MCRWWYRTTLQLSEQMCNALSTWSCCWGQLFEYVGFCRNDSGTCKTSSKYVESTTLSVSDVPALFLEMLLFLVSSCLGGNISTVFGKAWRRLAQSWTVKFEPKGCRALPSVSLCILRRDLGSWRSWDHPQWVSHQWCVDIPLTISTTKRVNTCLVPSSDSWITQAKKNGPVHQFL